MWLNDRNNRGSVLVMVLGMLTILFILGSTFLAISHMNAKVSDAVLSTSQVEPLAEGLVAIIKDQIGKDRPISNDGAYTQLPPALGVTGWKMFVDYPSDLVDPWLASPLVSGNVRHPSNTHGALTFTSTGVDFPGTPDSSYADTDLDGKPDSLFFDTYVTNPNGERYFAAVRVDDSSQFPNANVCGLLERTAICTVSTVPDRAYSILTLNGVNARDVDNAQTMNWTGINLAGRGVRLTFTNSANTCAAGIAEAYTTVVSQNNSVYTLTVSPAVSDRTPNAYCEILFPYPSEYRPASWSALSSGPNARNNGASMLMYATMSAWRLYSPPAAAAYKPFGICEEPAARLGGNAVNLPALRSGVVAGNTVHSSSPNVSRQASQTFPTRFLITAGTLDALSSRQSLINELTKLDGPLDMSLPASEDKFRQATHFVANLWAASSTRNTLDNCTFAVTGTGGYTAYGVVEQLCFSEAFAFHYSSTTDKIDGRIRAFEIMNPTDVAIHTATPTGDLTYLVKCGTATYSLESLRIDPGARIVLYWYEGVGKSGTITTPFVVPSSTNSTITVPAPRWFNRPEINDFGNSPIELHRRVYPPAPAAPVDLPADKISAGDLGYNMNTGPDTEVARHGSRDDAVAQLSAGDARRPTYRALLPVMKTEALVVTATSYGQHTLGASNAGVRSTDTAFDPVPVEGFTIRRYMPADVADFCNLYVVGPETDSAGAFTDLPNAFKKCANNVSRGRLVPVPESVFAVNSLTGRYPDVPMHALVSEIVTFNSGDSYRTDEPIAPLRIYGRLNINTASETVLGALPWVPRPTSSTGASTLLIPRNSGTTGVFVQVYPDTNKIAQYIIAYRDRATIGSRDYSDRATASKVTNLRAVDWPGFASAAEIAVPLADYMNDLMGYTNYAVAPTFVDNAVSKNLQHIHGYVEARDVLYRAVANMITVNSDTYTAHITVQLRDRSGQPRFTWYYMAAFDRSNMTLPRYGAPVQLRPFDPLHPVPEPALTLFTRIWSR